MLMATLRWGALMGGPEHPLYAGLVNPVDSDAVTLPSVSSALTDETVWDALAHRSVQTNETSRAVVWRLPAALISAIQPNARFSLFDVGASAGLNLVGDRLNAPWTDQDGCPVIQNRETIDIVQRTGFDKAPLDVNLEEDMQWLYACVWPGLSKRLERLSRAITAFRKSSRTERMNVLRCNASEAPSQMNGLGDVSLAYQSLLHDYLPAAEKKMYEAGMHAWLRLRPGRNWWIELEISKNAPSPETAALIRARCFDGETLCTHDLARCHPHPDRLVLNRDQLHSFSDTVRRTLGDTPNGGI